MVDQPGGGEQVEEAHFAVALEVAIVAARCSVAGQLRPRTTSRDVVPADGGPPEPPVRRLATTAQLRATVSCAWARVRQQPNRQMSSRAGASLASGSPQGVGGGVGGHLRALFARHQSDSAEPAVPARMASIGGTGLSCALATHQPRHTDLLLATRSGPSPRPAWSTCALLCPIAAGCLAGDRSFGARRAGTGGKPGECSAGRSQMPARRGGLMCRN